MQLFLYLHTVFTNTQKTDLGRGVYHFLSNLADEVGDYEWNTLKKRKFIGLKCLVPTCSRTSSNNREIHNPSFLKNQQKFNFSIIMHTSNLFSKFSNHIPIKSNASGTLPCWPDSPHPFLFKHFSATWPMEGIIIIFTFSRTVFFGS